MNGTIMKAAFCVSLAGSLLILPKTTTSVAGQQSFVLDKFLQQEVGLNTTQTAEIHRGKAIATVVDSPAPEQVFMFGIVYVNSAPEKYLQLANDFDSVRKLPGYLAVQKFSDPPQASDLLGFTISSEDLNDLKNCKPGDCDVQLPSEAMDQFRKSVNWTAPDAESRANELAQRMALDAVLAYRTGGNAALGVYRDKNHPTKVAETFQSLLNRLKSLPVYLPEVSGLLLEYPAVAVENSESKFYWEKVNFGLKPTLRIVQHITYRGGTPAAPTYAVALKQLYASHYFQSALDLTVCVKDSARPWEPGFYLITVKGSQQAGLTGLKGGVVRKVAVGKTRSSLETTLTAIKQKLEAGAR
ncbi:MAG TPA: hypothetical protein VE422_21890 [Terriglobia bacterium]|nr:hypothetical protein [Terriglobia bacterium]